MVFSLSVIPLTYRYYPEGTVKLSTVQPYYLHEETIAILCNRFPPEIISHTVWLYHRFTLSFRDIEDRLADGGIIVTYETVRQQK